MMKDVIVTILRRFRPTTHFEEWEILFPEQSGKLQRWNDIETNYRLLILAAPGAGKTFEARARATKLLETGRKAFFIRIEQIDQRFESAFEVGTADEFQVWLNSNEEAWFFLDSVDEARLETPRAFENAIKLFGERIYNALERAHVVITSREDAWQALTDRTLIAQNLPHSSMQAKKEISEDEEDGQSQKEEEDTARRDGPGITAYHMAGLSLDEIKVFAAQYGVSDVVDFVAALERGNVTNLAQWPFDLKALIRKWQADGHLGSRFDVLTRMVDLQLQPLGTATTRSTRISVEKARLGVRNLAAAAMLTGKTVIRLPEALLTPDRIDPFQVLPGWTNQELDALLRTGVFDDVVYGSVRFRHREIRELLTAQWAFDLLQHEGARVSVEGLFFRSVYDETIIIPRMRPALIWLILLDGTIRDQALSLEPDIASEGGDPSRLPLGVRQKMLADIVSQMASESE